MFVGCPQTNRGFIVVVYLALHTHKHEKTRVIHDDSFFGSVSPFSTSRKPFGNGFRNINSLASGNNTCPLRQLYIPNLRENFSHPPSPIFTSALVVPGCPAPWCRTMGEQPCERWLVVFMPLAFLPAAFGNLFLATFSFRGVFEAVASFLLGF